MRPAQEVSDCIAEARGQRLRAGQLQGPQASHYGPAISAQTAQTERRVSWWAVQPERADAVTTEADVQRRRTEQRVSEAVREGFERALCES